MKNKKRIELETVGCVLDPTRTRSSNLISLLSVLTDKEAGCAVRNEDEIRTMRFVHLNIDQDISESREPSVSACGLCGCEPFGSRDDQITHYQSEFHRYNLRRKLKNKPVITEDEFEDQLSEDELSNSESSADEMDEANDQYNADDTATNVPTFLRQTSQYYFVEQCATDEASSVVLSVYKRVLPNWSNKGLDLACLPTPTEMLNGLQSNSRWAIILLAGGHFAAAIFEGSDIVLHKTLHRYTIRAKQGFAQRSRDGKQSGKAPKSGGATLRRYNEQALAQDIKSLLSEPEWDVARLGMIFLRCSTFDRTIFVPDIFGRGDSRLRAIPFMTNRPSFEEVKRVHRKLTAIISHGPLVDFLSDHSLDQDSICENAQGSAVAKGNRTKLKERKQVKPSDGTPKKEKNRIRKTDAESPSTDSAAVTEEPSLPDSLTRELYTACRTGNVQALLTAVEGNSSSSTREIVVEYLSSTLLGADRQTYLHHAASDGNCPMVRALLDIGCDPTVRNKRGQVAFQLSANKAVRREFSAFRDVVECDEGGQQAVVIDWNRAQIPSLPSAEVEAERRGNVAEKRRRERANRRVREKEQREADKQRQAEEYERGKFLALSDREKRALAAERRFLADQLPTLTVEIGEEQAKRVVLSRCFQCAKDITGVVPFEYNSSRFCTMKCLKEHRSVANT